jgi:hypothetical protein
VADGEMIDNTNAEVMTTPAIIPQYALLFWREHRFAV